MKKFFVVAGSFILALILMACPICLPISIIFHWHEIIMVLLLCATIVEFFFLVWFTFIAVDSGKG